MWVLKWDEDLAKLAQSYANLCIFEHNQVTRPKSVGENLGWKCYNKEIVADAKFQTTLWWDEIKDYHLDGENDHEKVGHFTQMIWGNVKFVGCGRAFYQDGTHESCPYQTLLVCNYKPGGNVKGQFMYAKLEEGDSICSRGVQSKKYPKLCAHDQDHADGKYVPCSGTKQHSSFEASAIFPIVFFLTEKNDLTVVH
nr:venom allergen 5.02-like [Halyomorpha halys]